MWTLTVKTLAPLYCKEIPSPLSYKAWEIRRKESYSPKPKSKLTRGQPQRHRPSFGQRADVVSRLQQLLSPGKLSLEDKRKLARASGRARAVVLAEFPWVSASKLTQWNKPAARKQRTDRLQGCTRAGGRG